MVDAAWDLAGNAGADPKTSFLGTTDQNALIVCTNGKEVMRCDLQGNVGIGLAGTSPNAPQQMRLHVRSSGGVDQPQIQISQAGRTASARLRFHADSATAQQKGVAVTSPPAGSNWDIAASSAAMTFSVEQYGGFSTQQFGPARRPSRTLMTLGTDGSLDLPGVATVNVLRIAGGDLAEYFPVSLASSIEPGSVLVLDDKRPGHLALSSCAYDQRVVGVVAGAGSTNPGVLLGCNSQPSYAFPVALAGCVHCLAEAGASEINPGDLLTTSDTPGHAMRADDGGRAPGAILGKAMTGLSSGNGLVMILVSLH